MCPECTNHVSGRGNHVHFHGNTVQGSTEVLDHERKIIGGLSCPMKAQCAHENQTISIPRCVPRMRRCRSGTAPLFLHASSTPEHVRQHSDSKNDHCTKQSFFGERSFVGIFLGHYPLGKIALVSAVKAK